MPVTGNCRVLVVAERAMKRIHLMFGLVEGITLLTEVGYWIISILCWSTVLTEARGVTRAALRLEVH
jgi:hypothetical protein